MQYFSNRIELPFFCIAAKHILRFLDTRNESLRKDPLNVKKELIYQWFPFSTYFSTLQSVSQVMKAGNRFLVRYAVLFHRHFLSLLSFA